MLVEGRAKAFVPLVNLRHINQNLMLTYIPRGLARETKDFCNLEENEQIHFHVYLRGDGTVIPHTALETQNMAASANLLRENWVYI